MKLKCPKRMSKIENVCSRIFGLMARNSCLSLLHIHLYTQAFTRALKHRFLHTHPRACTHRRTRTHFSFIRKLVPISLYTQASSFRAIRLSRTHQIQQLLTLDPHFKRESYNYLNCSHPTLISCESTLFISCEKITGKDEKRNTGGVTMSNEASSKCFASVLSERQSAVYIHVDDTVIVSDVSAKQLHSNSLLDPVVDGLEDLGIEVSQQPKRLKRWLAMK